MADVGVSVIVSTFNYSAVLPYSIGSALAQTVAPLEVLVVGDHCTDDTAEVVAAIGDDRVRFVNLPTRTRVQSGPNNEGLAQAAADVVAYLGHDDLWLPDHLAHLMPALERGADVAYEMTLFVRPGQAAMLVPRHYQRGMWIPPTVVAHRRGASERVGGWHLLDQLQSAPDIDVWARMHEAGLRIEFVPRLGAVKFPAGLRKSVYMDRPCHEQAAWAARIASEPELEVTEALRAAMSLAASAAATPGREIIPAVTAELGRRARRRLPEMARRARRRLGDPGADFHRRYENRLRYKGGADGR